MGESPSRCVTYPRTRAAASPPVSVRIRSMLVCMPGHPLSCLPNHSRGRSIRNGKPEEWPSPKPHLGGWSRMGQGVVSFRPVVKGAPQSSMPSGRSSVPFRSSAKRKPRSNPGQGYSVRTERFRHGECNKRFRASAHPQPEPSRLEDWKNGSAP